MRTTTAIHQETPGAAPPGDDENKFLSFALPARPNETTHTGSGP